MSSAQCRFTAPGPARRSHRGRSARSGPEAHGGSSGTVLMLSNKACFGHTEGTAACQVSDQEQ